MTTPTPTPRPEAVLLDTDPIPWTAVPGADGQQVKLLSYDPVNGGVVALLKSAARSQLVPHRHLSAVHVLTLTGRWGYDDHRVGPLGYVYEPANAHHHPVADTDSDDDVITFIVTLGPFVDMHPDGTEVIIDAPTLYAIVAANGAADHLPPMAIR